MFAKCFVALVEPIAVGIGGESLPATRRSYACDAFVLSDECEFLFALEVIANMMKVNLPLLCGAVLWNGSHSQ